MTLAHLFLWTEFIFKSNRAVLIEINKKIMSFEQRLACGSHLLNMRCCYSYLLKCHSMLVVPSMSNTFNNDVREIYLRGIKRTKSLLFPIFIRQNDCWN